jgi:hypothetical protein
LTNVIKNGDFEKNTRAGVATYWEPFRLGEGHFGWYDERWEEAVHSGKHSQLMEIEFVDALPNRVIAIYQTVKVVPNANYHLTIHALMRSAASLPLRDQGDFAMSWGIDYRGQGAYLNVDKWIDMELPEQARVGSGAPFHEQPQHLRFKLITATIFTTNTNQITLFIRGVKVVPVVTEVNFNVDDVSLIGPFFPPPAPVPVGLVPASEAVPAAVPVTGAPAAATTAKVSLPDAGAPLSRTISTGALVLGGVVLVVLGGSAVAGLLYSRKTDEKIGQK